MYGRTGTNSFKGGSLPSEVIGPGGTKYFEEIGPGDQFLRGTIYFMTITKLYCTCPMVLTLSVQNQGRKSYECS